LRGTINAADVAHDGGLDQLPACANPRGRDIPTLDRSAAACDEKDHRYDEADDEQYPGNIGGDTGDTAEPKHGSPDGD
jgi:hypothetical protein